MLLYISEDDSEIKGAMAEQKPAIDVLFTVHSCA